MRIEKIALFFRQKTSIPACGFRDSLAWKFCFDPVHALRQHIIAHGISRNFLTETAGRNRTRNPPGKYNHKTQKQPEPMLDHANLHPDLPRPASRSHIAMKNNVAWCIKLARNARGTVIVSRAIDSRAASWSA